MWYVCDVLYAVLYVCVSCFVVRRCAVSRRYIDVCNCDVFSVVNVYPDHLKGGDSAAMMDGEGVVMVSSGSTRGSVVVSSADDVLEMSVVRGVVCEMRICLARGGM